MQPLCLCLSFMRMLAEMQHSVEHFAKIVELFIKSEIAYLNFQQLALKLAANYIQGHQACQNHTLRNRHINSLSEIHASETHT